MNQPLEDTAEPRAGYRWALVVFMMLLVMILLSASLWRRVQRVDPLQRCADAFASSYTAVDTTLVDRMRVRVPGGAQGKTTCGELRRSGAVQKVPRRQLRVPGGGPTM